LFFFGPEDADDVTTWEEALTWFNYATMAINDAGELVVNIKDTWGKSVYGLHLFPQVRSCLVKMDPNVVLCYARSTLCLSGRGRGGYSALVMGSDVLGYGTFNAVCVLRDRAARLTQPALDARSARAGHVGGNVSVGCVETLTLAWSSINEPWCVETQHACPDAGGTFSPNSAK